MYFPPSVCTVLADASTYSPSAPAQTLSYSGGWERGRRGKVKRGGWEKQFSFVAHPECMLAHSILLASSPGLPRLLRHRSVVSSPD